MDKRVVPYAQGFKNPRPQTKALECIPRQSGGLAANALGARYRGRACIWESREGTKTQGAVGLGTHRDTYGPGTFIVGRNAETLGNR